MQKLIHNRFNEPYRIIDVNNNQIRIEDILNYVAEVKESLDRHKLNNRSTGIKRVAQNCKKFIKCCKYAAKN